MKTLRSGFRPIEYLGMLLATGVIFLLCVCLGSVVIPLKETWQTLWSALTRPDTLNGLSSNILLSVRIPRVICVALTGAALSVSGAAMQGLLKNPLADGSTLGVSSGAALGAILSMAFGITIHGLPMSGRTGMAILFAFISLMIILTVAYHLDHSLSTNTIILLGIVFSMFISSLSNLVITFAGERVRSITFWTLGSLQGSSYGNAILLGCFLLVFGGIILHNSDELNAFSIGEDNARSIGIDVQRVKMMLLISVSVLVGVCVSIGGTIGFVGLAAPHIIRAVIGPNHRKLLPASLFGGAQLLMLCDLISRTILRPRELPIGVVTSLIGTAVFLSVYFRNRKGGIR